MPYSTRQIKRILDEDGTPVLLPGRVGNLSLWVTESYLRRKAYAWEDRAVGQQWDVFNTAYKNIREFANDEAEARGISKPERDRPTLAWKAAVKQYARFQLTEAMQKTAQDSFRHALTAWNAGYYGGAWQLDMMTTPETTVNMPEPSSYQVHRDVLLPRLQEQVQQDGALWDLLGADFRELYNNELAEMVVKVNRAFDNGVNNADDFVQIMQAVRDAMGIQANKTQGFKKNFHRVQSITRTAIMESTNAGRQAIYVVNAPPAEERNDVDLVSLYLLSQMEFLTANDRRVCSVCSPHDGKVWSLFDPTAKRPPLHGNCRCTLIPVVARSLLVPDHVPPRNTLNEWLAFAGAGMLLGEYMDSGLSSTQV